MNTNFFMRLCLAIAMIVTLAGAAQAQAPARFQLVIPQSSYEIGESFPVDIILDAGSSAPTLIGVFLQYDRTRLRLDSGATNRTVFANNLLTSEPSDASDPGVVSFSAAALNGLAGTGIRVARLNFTALSSGSVGLKFLNTPPRQTSALNVLGVAVPVVLESRSVTVNAIPTASIRISPGFLQTDIGTTATLQVRVDLRDTDTRSLRFAASFDPSIVQFIGGSINGGVFDSVLLTEPATSPAPGIVTFAAGATGPISGDNVFVANLQFLPIANGQSEIQLLRQAPLHTTAKSVTYQTIPTLTSDGLIDVGSQTFARLRLAPNRQSVPTGEPVRVDVLLDTAGVNAGLVEGFVSYDRSRLVYTGGSLNTTAFGNTLINQPPVDQNGVLTFAASSGVAVTGTGIRVATLNFRSIGTGAAPFEFLAAGSQQSRVSSPDLTPLPTRRSGATATMTSPGASTLRLTPKARSHDYLTSFTVELRLDQVGPPAREARVVLSYEPSLIQFLGGTVNTALFNNGSRTSPPTVTGPGVISFTAAASDDVAGPDQLVATLQFESYSTLGTAPFELLRRTPSETALLTEGFTTLPLNLGSAAAFIVGNVPLLDSILPTGSSPTNAHTIAWDVRFTKPVTGVEESDFTITGATALIAGFSVASTAPDLYTVTASVNTTATLEGFVRLNLLDDDSIIDGDGAPLAGEGRGNGNAAGPQYFVDRRPPTPVLVQILPSPAEPNATVLIQFGEPVTGFTTGGITIGGGGSLVALTGSGAVYTAEVQLPPAGSATMQVVAGAANDLAGNPNLASSEATLRLASTIPTVAISPSAPVLTNAGTIFYDLVFSEEVTGLAIQSFTLVSTGGLTPVLSELTPGLDGLTYRATITVPPGNGTLSLGYDPATSPSPIRNLDGVGLEAFLAAVHTFDRVAPTGTATRLDDSPTNSATVRFQLEASELLAPLTPANFNLVAGGLAGASIISIESVGLLHTINVSTGGGQGSLGLALSTTTPPRDPAGNPLESFVAPPVYTVDRVAPSFTVIRLDPNPTAADQVRFRVTASEEVLGLATALTLQTPGVTGASISLIDQVGLVYTVTVSTGTGSGSLGLTLGSLAGVTDLVGNSPLTFSSPIYTVDRTGPSLAATRAGDSPTSAGTLVFNLTSNEPIVGVALPSLVLSTAGVINASIISVTGSGSNYEVTVAGVSGNGTIALALAAGSPIRDLFGNAVIGFTSEAYNIDQTPPSVVSSTGLGNLTTHVGTVGFSLLFTESVTGVTTGTLQLTTTGDLTGATITAISGSGTTYQVTVNTGLRDGTIRLDVPAGPGIRDHVGNPLSGPFTSGQSFTILREGRGPTGLFTEAIYATIIRIPLPAPDLTTAQLDINGDGIIDAADGVSNTLQLVTAP